MKPNPNRDSDGLLPMVTEIKDLFAIKVRARWLAKKAVVAELKAKNVWVTLVRPAEINERAKAYLSAHPELYDAAFESFKKPDKIAQARMHYFATGSVKP